MTVEEPQAFPRGIITSMEGLEVIAGRQIHGESEESPVWIQCPKCENREEDDFSLWFDATVPPRPPPGNSLRAPGVIFHKLPRRSAVSPSVPPAS